MSIGTITVLNKDKGYLIVDAGTTSVYLKMYHVKGDRNKIKIGDQIEYDKSIGGFDIESSVDLKPTVKI